jgi:hypothetical protein
MKIGDRVIVNGGCFGSGVIQDVISDMYVVKCDDKLPNAYAWETDTSLFFAKDLEKEK